MPEPLLHLDDVRLVIQGVGRRRGPERMKRVLCFTTCQPFKALCGTNRAQIASAALEDTAKAAPGLAVLTTQEQLRRFRELADEIPARPGPPVDVSRDRIYDRGVSVAGLAPLA
jgi:hypothetical protein